VQNTFWTFRVAQKPRSRRQGSATQLNVKANAQRNERVFVLREQNARQNSSTKVGKEFFGRVTKFRYLGKTRTNQNGVHEEVKKTQ
jgi:hypothetical protein